METRLLLPPEIEGLLDEPSQAIEQSNLRISGNFSITPPKTALPPGMISGLRAVPQQFGRPLIVVRVHRAGPGRVLVLCANQNRHLAFAETLSQVSRDIGGSLFLDALKHGLMGDVYESAFAFFDWLHQPVGTDEPALVLIDDDDEALPGYGGLPIYDYDPGAGLALDIQQRATMLMIMFEAHERTIGSDQAGGSLVEALAFALSRHCGLIGDYETGLNFVNRAMGIGHRPVGYQYIHLEACRHVLELKQRGLKVHPRLEKFAGEDTGWLKDFTCKQPYVNMQIVPTGHVFICCPTLVPYAMGNISTENLDAVLNSPMAKKLRESVVDGSFQYCDHVSCPLMAPGTLPRKDSDAIESDPLMRSAIHDDKREVETVRVLNFGYDASCNLSCPSCRTKVMVEKYSNIKTTRKTVDEKLIPLLPSLENLFLNSTGEFLVSKPSRSLLKAIEPGPCAKLKIDILSNGTLFSESEWNKFSNIHGLVRTVQISTDAAYRETFEKVRRGGAWDIFLENIKFLGRLRRENRIVELDLNFTYQLANFREMKAFVRLCEDIGADKALFHRLSPNSAMTFAEYKEMAVHKWDHPLHQEFLEIIDDPCFRQPNVSAEFEGALP